MYNYYPYQNPYQQRLMQLEQQQPYQQAPQALGAPQSVPMLKGRIVGSIEEARAAQVDLDGSTTYFACPGESKIYTKSIGMNGLPVFAVYALQQNEQDKKIYADSKELAALAQRVEKLEEALK